MTCMWKELLLLLPSRLRPEAEALGQARLQEIRLRLGAPALFQCRGQAVPSRAAPVEPEDLAAAVAQASRFSAYAARSIARGYLTAPGGHRLGLCGRGVERGGEITGMQDLTSLCIRVAKDITGIGQALADAARSSVLILGPPGAGKTTLLRDAVRCLGRQTPVAVVDEREELFPCRGGRLSFLSGGQVDVLSGWPKAQGMEALLRAMGPGWIAVDEITSAEDCAAMERCSYCGVRFLATAHAVSPEDLKRRPVYRQLLECGLFQYYALLDSRQQYTMGRLPICSSY